MFIKEDLIVDAIKGLESVHPFYGITFLACKKNNLPVGRAIEFSINTNETRFLEDYYKPIPKSEKFFRVFRTSDKLKFWLNSDYASSGSQANRTQQFGDAFIHNRNTDKWGWVNNYVEILSNHLGNRKIPLWHLIIWLYRDYDWDGNATTGTIENNFIKDFKISAEELNNLFNRILPNVTISDNLFSSKVYNWDSICQRLKIPSPPDLPQGKGGSLVSLAARNIGEINFEMTLKNRLNIITGDNGLGKSFILECAWWALTGTWTGFPLYPNFDDQTIPAATPEISFEISNKDGRIESYTGSYNWRSQQWRIESLNKKTVAGLIIYARVDGAFAIWDPASKHSDKSEITVPVVFTREDIWNGVHIIEGNKSRSVFNGIITDWVHWKNSKSTAFEMLKKVLKRLSPPDLKHGDLGLLIPGEIVRLPNESRPIPTIRHPYGEVPITLASAAVKRIIALAYLIVWTWEEHKISSNLIREEPETKMVVIADEIESHLHPQWQRVILPALTALSEDLSKGLNIQYLITTHSPLVMASVESLYNENIDKIFHLNLRLGSRHPEVDLESPDFQRRGSADSWLISDIFDLKQPRSIEAEEAIEKAKDIQKEEVPNKKEIALISKSLLKVLPPHDPFWIRWNYFAEQNGITED